MTRRELGDAATTVVAEGSDLLIERVFAAPRELVWAAMTTAEHLARWIGPHGTTTEVAELDLRPGGRWKWINGDVAFLGEYLEVDPPKRLVRTTAGGRVQRRRSARGSVTATATVARVPPAPATRNVTGADDAYQLIREQILSGHRVGGDWLREGELADTLGVSRTPVREALRRLTAEGLVRYERNRGVQVQDWSQRDLDEIFSLRAVLEPWGCSLAATAGKVDVAFLDDLATQMDKVAPGGRPTDVDKLTDLNNLFHRTILEGAENSRLSSVISSVIQVPLVWRTFTRYTPEALQRSLAHHHELVAALTAQDPDWSESVMRSHVKAAWHSLRTADSEPSESEQGSVAGGA